MKANKVQARGALKMMGASNGSKPTFAIAVSSVPPRYSSPVGNAETTAQPGRHPLDAIRPPYRHLPVHYYDGEVERGIEKQRTTNPSFAGDLERWLQLTLRSYRDRILQLDVGSVLRWGRISARVGHAGLDLAIAATALEHGLTVVTRNSGGLFYHAPGTPLGHEVEFAILAKHLAFSHTDFLVV